MIIIARNGTFTDVDGGVNYVPDYQFDKASYEAKLKDVDSKLDEIVKDIRPLKNDLHKEIKIHDYIVKNVTYLKTENARNILDPLYHHNGICVGISIFFKALLERCNIECNCVAGFLTKKAYENGKPGHVWNSVKINNNWYLVDVTLDLSDSYKDISYEHLNFLNGDYFEEYYTYPNFTKYQEVCTSTKS